MATVFPSPSTGVPTMVDQSPPQNLYPGAPRPRSYTPYVFQPNFLKQQLKQRMNELLPGLPPDSVGTGANSIPLGGRDKLGYHPSQPPSSQINSSNMQQPNSGTQNVPSFLDDIAGRKKMGRKVIDWTSSCALHLENRRFDREIIDVPDMLPDTAFTMEMQSVISYKTNPVTSITSKFIRSATNKMKCPVYKVVWTPDGRRLVTGSASGEFTLWNGTAFNFETILQAHDCPVRAMAWSKHDNWLITGDNQGYIKYWQLNMNNVKMYQAHKDQACRSVSFGPTDHKFATASDDGTVRIWDFLRCHEERILRGHGADVKQIDWHPTKGIVASASKDLHTPVKLWDPKTGQSLATLHAHKGTVMDVKWNQNGNWVLSASRDHLIKLYDIRNLKQEMQVFRGHKKEAFSVAWHPIHEDLFASGGSEGSILFWQVGEEKEAGMLEGAHDSLIWSLAWHPLGHVLVSGSNDHSTKFWARSRPGDSMRDRYNLCLLPQVQDEPKITPNIGAIGESSDNPARAQIIPGMGDADVAAAEVAKRDEEEQKSGIPGLDWSYEEKNEFDRKMSSQFDRRKFAYARPVPRAFVAAWEANKEGAPPERPRSPRFHDRERDFGRPRWRDRFDGPPYKHGRDFRNGPVGKDSGGEDDNKIFVDGVEVGPDFNPDEITGEQVSPERELDRRRHSPMRGRDRPPRDMEHLGRRGRSPPMGGHDRPPMDGPPNRPFRGEPDRYDRPPPDMQDRPFMGGPDGGLGPDRLHMSGPDRPPLGVPERPPMGAPDRGPMAGPDRPPMGGPDRPLRSESDIPPLMSIDGPPIGGPGPPSPNRPRRPSNPDNHKLRNDLYDELLRSGSERDMELMRELEEHGLALEDGLVDEPEVYFDENGDPIGYMGPNNMRGRFGSQDEPPRFRGDNFVRGRGRGFRNPAERGGGHGGFPPERGLKRRGSRSHHSPPPRMRRGRGGPKR